MIDANALIAFFILIFGVPIITFFMFGNFLLAIVVFVAIILFIFIKIKLIEKEMNSKRDAYDKYLKKDTRC